MHSRISAIAATLLLAAAPRAFADTITLAQAHAVVEQEQQLVTKYYVFPEKRAAIIAAIRAKDAAGAYNITNPAELADKLGGDAIAASHDKHMWMLYDLAQFAAVTAAAQQKPDAAPAPEPPRRDNYGYVDMHILPGNVRYVNLKTFNWESKKVPEAVTDAARFLGGGDAVIIDLRQNGGGSGDAVRAMISYFMPAKKQELMAYIDTTTGVTDHSNVDLELSAPRMVGKPLYVLISGNTGSAAEEFAYHIKMFKLGTLVGETTAGAGNNDTIYPMTVPGFVVSISTGRTVHPVSGTNWEGVGVPPDVTVAADKALDQAELLALGALAKTPGPNADSTKWAMLDIGARLSPPAKLDATALAAYAGTYGVRTIKVEDGVLIFQRQGRPQRTLTYLGSDLFAIDEDTRVHFRRSGDKVTGFDMTTSAGQAIAAERTN